MTQDILVERGNQQEERNECSDLGIGLRWLAYKGRARAVNPSVGNGQCCVRTQIHGLDS
jgi:hypothetical protein